MIDRETAIARIKKLLTNEWVVEKLDIVCECGIEAHTCETCELVALADVL